MQIYMRPGLALARTISIFFLVFAQGCSREEEGQLSQQAAEQGEAVTSNEATKQQEGPTAEDNLQQIAEAQSEHESMPSSSVVNEHDRVPTVQKEADETEPTGISAEQLGPPVSREELSNHPLLKELARRHRTEIQGLQVQYDYSGRYGRNGIADKAFAYLDGRLIGEARALRLLGETPSKIEVEEIHYSESGQVLYRGTTLFVVGNAWSSGDTPVLPGAPLSSTAIDGSKERTIFNRWPVGQAF